MTFDAEFEQLKKETMRKHDEIYKQPQRPGVLDGPRALQAKELNAEFARKLQDLKKKYGK